MEKRADARKLLMRGDYLGMQAELATPKLPDDSIHGFYQNLIYTFPAVIRELVVSDALNHLFFN